MSAYGIIFLFMAVGFILKQTEWSPPRAADWLNQAAIVLCLPALILIHVPALTPDASLLPLIIIPWSLLIITILLVVPLARGLGWSREVTAVLLVLLPLGNTSFLGFPLVKALLGDSALPLAVVYDQFGSFLMVSTHVLWVIGWYSSKTRPTFLDMGLRLIKFPPFLALVVALVFGHDWMGNAGFLIAEGLALLLLPIVTLAIGLSLEWRLETSLLKPLVFGVTAKLGLLPLCALILLAFMGPSEASSAVPRVALLESAMPSMITAAALLSRANLAPSLASAMVAWTVLFSILTVPIWFWMGAWVFGPI